MTMPFHQLSCFHFWVNQSWLFASTPQETPDLCAGWNSVEFPRIPWSAGTEGLLRLGILVVRSHPELKLVRSLQAANEDLQMNE